MPKQMLPAGTGPGDRAFGGSLTTKPEQVFQIVPYVSDDGAYGGPTTVAIEQTHALRRQGVSVTLLAGWDGVAKTPVSPPIRLFRSRKLSDRSWASLWTPGLWLWL